MLPERLPPGWTENVIFSVEDTDYPKINGLPCALKELPSL
jgi:hypothetical protein